MITRNTIQKTLVLEAVAALGCHATAEEVYQRVILTHPSISKATVYRNLNQLAQAGEIRRVSIPGDADRFDHLRHPHYHFKCRSCGRVLDLDMDYLPQLESQVRDAAGFQFEGHDIVFRGLCPQCSQQD